MVRYLIHKILEKNKFLRMNFFPRSTLEKHNKAEELWDGGVGKDPHLFSFPSFPLSYFFEVSKDPQKAVLNL